MKIYRPYPLDLNLSNYVIFLFSVKDYFGYFSGEVINVLAGERVAASDFS
jgi:hypothetical protein